MSTLIERLKELYIKLGSKADMDYRKELSDLETQVDSTTTNSEARILWLLATSYIQVRNSQSEKASSGLDEAENLAIESQKYDLLPKIYHLRAVLKLRLGLTEEAFQLLLKAHTAAKVSKDYSVLAKTSLNLGVLYANSGDYDEAGNYLKRCIEYAAQGVVEPGEEAQAHLILAQAHLERGVLEEAYFHAVLSVETYTKIGSMSRAATAALLLASINLERKDIEGSRQVLLSINNDLLTPFQRVSMLNLTAKFNCLNQAIGQALSTHDAAIELATQIGNPRLKNNSIELKCETLLLTNRAREALELLSRITEDKTQGYDLLTLYELRGKALESIERYKEALIEHKKYTELQKNLLGESASNALSRLRSAQEVLQAERETAHFRERSQFYANELSQRTSYLVQQNEYVNEVIDHIQTLASQHPESIELLKDIRKRLRQLPAASFDWTEYLRLFDEIHPNALGILEQMYPDLSKTESKICSLVLARLSNVEIARLLSVSARTVENHRYRLRKKLGLSVDMDLAVFLERILVERSTKGH